MGPVICLVGAVGALIAILLIVIMCIAGKKAYAPLGLFAICVVVMLVSGMLPGETTKSGVLYQSPSPSKADEAKDAQDYSSLTESKTPSKVKDGLPAETTLKNGPAYEITYQNSKIYRDSTDSVECYAIVEIENTGNVDLYLDDAMFDFEDEGGNLLATYSSIISSDPDIIAPGEKGYFYCNAVSLSGSIDENSEYIFSPKPKIKESKNEIIRYDISDVSITEGNFIAPVEIIGRVTNNTSEDEGLVWICCILYRDDETPIAAFGTNITDLGAGETQSFNASAVYLSWLDLDFSDIADYKVYACKTQYQF